jgi:glycosyltransferase involved in cell wall biosynthesis
MNILSVLTYYRPHTSGLTIYAERLARAFAARGHGVTVMTTQFDRTLPREELLDGVRVVRVPIVARVSKGVLAPTLGYVATKLVARHDVVQLHLPQFDAPGVALRARYFRKPAVLTYHCDLRLPGGAFNRMVNSVVHFQNHLAGRLAKHIVTYTADYAQHSPYLSRYRAKLTPILPPVSLPAARPGAVAAFADRHRTSERRPVIGMAARLAADKGVEVLLDALPAVLARHPRAQVLFAGQYEDVLGEQAYASAVMPRIRRYQQSGHWTFLGTLDPVEMAAFYPNLDVLTVPSLNSTEAFGLVQIEAMLHGVPCVTADLPGVRQPVRMHGMGQIVPIGDALALGDALLKVLDTPGAFRREVETIAAMYDPQTVAAEYERLFQRLLERRR